MSSNPLPPAIFLMGPTASGKTDLAVALCNELPVEIISVDSALVYRDMNVGTAKPGADVLARAPHRLIDFLDPSETYSAADFRRDALREMAEVHAAGKTPLLVGGTMLYFRALSQGLAELPEAQPEVRRELDAMAERIGWQGMHRRLAEVDPESAARIHPNDPQRIQRALEVYELSGVSLSEHYARSRTHRLPYTVIRLVFAPSDRQVLRERIAVRFYQMLEQGLIEEVEALFRRGDLDTGLPSMRAVGYRQVWQYLEGKYSREEMIDKAITATRQLAKRQMTWLRAEQGAVWFDSLAPNAAEKVLNYLISIPING